MKLDELSVRDQKIDELSVGGVARGVGKTVGGIAKGVGALAGGVAGIGSALKKGFQAGKNVVGGGDNTAPAQGGSAFQGGGGRSSTGSGGTSIQPPAAAGQSSSQQPAATGQSSSQSSTAQPALGQTPSSGQETPQDTDLVSNLQNRIIKLDTGSQREIFKVLQAQAKKAPEAGQEQQPADNTATQSGSDNQAQDNTETPSAGATDQQQVDQKDWPQGVDKFNAITGEKFTSPEQAQDPQYLKDKEEDSKRLAQQNAQQNKANVQQDQKPSADFRQGGYGQTSTNAPTGLTPPQPDPTKQPEQPKPNFSQGGYGQTSTNAPTGLTPPQPDPTKQPSTQTTAQQVDQPAAQQTAQSTGSTETPQGGEGNQKSKPVDSRLRDKTTGRYTKDHTKDAGWQHHVSQFSDSKNNSKKSITESKKTFSLFKK
jgi:hypothetical protein